MSVVDVPIHAFPGGSETVEAPAIEPKRLPRVFIGLCSRDWQVEIHTSESVRNVGRHCKCEIIHPRYMLNDGVARARNNLTADFLATEATHLLFLDNDIMLEPWHVDRLLSHDLGIVAGFYPKKQPILDWVVNYLPGEKPDENGLMKLKHAGTGCLLITREVVLDIIEKLKGKIEYRGDPGPEAVRWDLFPMHAENGAYKSEDWFFCERARECGHVIWGDFRVQLRHVGKCVYPLQFTLTDDEVVDLVYHRYGIWPDHIKTFIASGNKEPGLMGGHRERSVRLWPRDYPVPDLWHGSILQGAFDVPLALKTDEAAPTVLDLGANTGAYARFCAKRWPGCTIISYEGHEDVFPYLQTTVEKLLGKESKGTAVGVEVDETNAAELPQGTILKIDLPGRERSILAALHAAGRLTAFEAIVLGYGDDTEAFFIGKLLDATHVLHCWQRFGENRGVMKFLSRKTEVVPQPARAESR